MKLPSILLEMCSGEKSDGRMDGWPDGLSDGRTKRRLYALPSGSIK